MIFFQFELLIDVFSIGGLIYRHRIHPMSTLHFSYARSNGACRSADDACSSDSSAAFLNNIMSHTTYVPTSLYNFLPAIYNPRVIDNPEISAISRFQANYIYI